MSRGNIKVMVASNGVTRIMEDTGATVKVWSAEEWAIELKRRSELPVEEKTDTQTVKKTKKGLIEDDVDESDGSTDMAEMETKKDTKLGKNNKTKKGKK